MEKPRRRERACCGRNKRVSVMREGEVGRHERQVLFSARIRIWDLILSAIRSFEGV